MRSTLGNAASAAGLILTEVAAVVALHELGGAGDLGVPLDELGPWLSATDPELAVVAAARLAGLLLAWWLLGSTVLYAAARAFRRDALSAAVGALTLPGVRRVLDRALVATVLTTTLFARPAGATSEPGGGQSGAEPRSGRVDPTSAPRAEEVRVGRVPEPIPEVPAPPPPAPPPGRSAPVVPERVLAPVPAGEPVPSPRVTTGTYVVVAGDDLWSIAARHVAGPGRLASAVPPTEVAPFWHALVERNRGRLRSGDPDLIYPGEMLELP